MEKGEHVKLVQLIKMSKLALWGLLAIVGGIGAFGYAKLHALPEEAQLQVVDGRIEKATKVTTRRRRSGESVSYEMVVKKVGDGTEIKLSMPAAEISEAQVRTVLNAQRMQAKFDAENDVYVLVADGRPLITYAATRARRISSDKTMADIGAGVGAGGLLLLLVGWLWNRRRLA